MNRLQDLQDKLFLDIQNIIQELSEINSLETLLQDDHLIKELSEKTAFLKLSQAFDINEMMSFPVIESNTINVEEESKTVVGTQTPDEVTEDLNLLDNQILAEAHQEEQINDQAIDIDLMSNDEELVMNDNLDLSDNEMFKEDYEDNQDKLETTESNIEESLVEEKTTPTFEVQEESHFSFAMEKPKAEEKKILEDPKENFISEISISEHPESSSDQRIIEKEKAFLESEVRRKQVIENNYQSIQPSADLSEDIQKDKILEESNLGEKKIKLSNIKGIHKTLFDEEHTESRHLEEKNADAGSLMKKNMPTNYMEAAKPKQEFRLDLNDKIAFTQHLFNNSQMDLNHVINRLNSFDNLEEAKEFLSDLYYQKKWENVDAYAQRLWTLVENKFL